VTRAKEKSCSTRSSETKSEKLDYFIATHPHPDHIGGADELLNGIKVGTVIDNGVDLSTPVALSHSAEKGSKTVADTCATKDAHEDRHRLL
jgi:beta-lactamase superfamily II metal-dependent hydrolase